MCLNSLKYLNYKHLVETGLDYRLADARFIARLHVGEGVRKGRGGN